MAGLAATGGWLAAVTEADVLVRANAAAAVCATAVLLAALVLRWAMLVPAAVALVGAEYAALLGFEGEGLDLRAPLVAAALFAAAELAYWSLELRGGVADEAGTHLRRVAVLASFLVATVALGLALLSLVEAVTVDGAALQVAGAAAAVGAVALLALAARRTG